MEQDIRKTGELTYRDLQNLNADKNNISAEEAYQNYINDNSDITSFDTASKVLSVSDPMQYMNIPNFGKATGDKHINSLYELSTYEDLRDKYQSFGAKVFNGIVKGIGLAGTTFVDGLAGLLFGTGTAIYNGVTGDNPESNWRQDFWSGFHTNPISDALRDVEKYMEDIMPHYYSKDAQENPMALRNILSGNMIGDSIIKNMGFMVGAFYSGNVFAAALRAPKMMKLFSAITKSTQAPRIASAAVGNVLMSFNEARIEASNATREFKELELMKAQDNYNSLLENIGKEEEYTGDSDLANQKRALAKQLYNEQLDKIEAETVRMGNNVMMGNMPVLLASNTVMYGRLLAGGKDLGRTLGLKGPLGNKTASKTTLGKWMVGPKRAFSEGSEEFLQSVVSKGSGYHAEDRIDSFYKQKLDPESIAETHDLLSNWGRAFEENIQDQKAWQEFFVGGVSSILGKVGMGYITTKSGKKIFYPKFEGGVIDEMKEYQQEMTKEQEHAEYVNKLFGDPKQAIENMAYLNRVYTTQKRMDDASASNDTKLYHDAKTDQFINDLVRLDNTGLLNDYMQFMQESMTDSKEDIDAIRELSKQVIKDANGKDITISAFSDENGNEMSDEQVVEEIKKRQKQFIDIANSYKEAKRKITSIMDMEVTDDQIAELTWLELKDQDATKRINQIGEDLKKHIGALKTTVNKQISDVTEELNKHKPESIEYKKLQEKLNSLQNYSSTINNILSNDGQYFFNLVSRAPKVLETIRYALSDTDLSVLDRQDYDAKFNDGLQLQKDKLYFREQLAKYSNKPEELVKKFEEERQKALSEFIDTIANNIIEDFENNPYITTQDINSKLSELPLDYQDAIKKKIRENKDSKLGRLENNERKKEILRNKVKYILSKLSKGKGHKNKFLSEQGFESLKKYVDTLLEEAINNISALNSEDFVKELSEKIDVLIEFFTNEEKLKEEYDKLDSPPFSLEEYIKSRKEIVKVLKKVKKELINLDLNESIATKSDSKATTPKNNPKQETESKEEGGLKSFLDKVEIEGKEESNNNIKKSNQDIIIDDKFVSWLKTAVDAISKNLESIDSTLKGYKQLSKGIERIKEIFEDNKDNFTEKALIELANEIARLEMNIIEIKKRNTFDVSKIAKHVNRIKDNFKANDYEIVEMLGKPYNGGMKVIATFVTDEKLEPGQQIISRVKKYQINKEGKMLQAAEIEVTRSPYDSIEEKQQAEQYYAEQQASNTQDTNNETISEQKTEQQIVETTVDNANNPTEQENKNDKTPTVLSNFLYTFWNYIALRDPKQRRAIRFTGDENIANAVKEYQEEMELRGAYTFIDSCELAKLLEYNLSKKKETNISFLQSADGKYIYLITEVFEEAGIDNKGKFITYNNRNFQVIGTLNPSKNSEFNAFYENIKNDFTNSTKSKVFTIKDSNGIEYKVHKYKTSIDRIYSGRIHKRNATDTKDIQRPINKTFLKGKTPIIGVKTSTEVVLSDPSKVSKTVESSFIKDGSIYLYVNGTDGLLYPTLSVKRSFEDVMNSPNSNPIRDLIIKNLKLLLDSNTTDTNTIASIKEEIFKYIYIHPTSGTDVFNSIWVNPTTIEIKILGTNVLTVDRTTQENSQQLSESINKILGHLIDAGQQVTFDIKIDLLTNEKSVKEYLDNIINSEILSTDLESIDNINGSFSIKPLDNNGNVIKTTPKKIRGVEPSQNKFDNTKIQYNYKGKNYMIEKIGDDYQITLEGNPINDKEAFEALFIYKVNEGSLPKRTYENNKGKEVGYYTMDYEGKPYYITEGNTQLILETLAIPKQTKSTDTLIEELNSSIITSQTQEEEKQEESKPILKEEEKPKIVEKEPIKNKKEKAKNNINKKRRSVTVQTLDSFLNDNKNKSKIEKKSKELNLTSQEVINKLKEIHKVFPIIDTESFDNALDQVKCN